MDFAWDTMIPLEFLNISPPKFQELNAEPSRSACVWDTQSGPHACTCSDELAFYCSFGLSGNFVKTFCDASPGPIYIPD